MFTFAFCNQKMHTVCHRKSTYLKVNFKTSDSSMDSLFLFIQEIFISDVYSGFKKFPSDCSVFIIWFSIALLILFFKDFENAQFV